MLSNPFSKTSSASISLTRSRFTLFKIFLRSSLSGLSRIDHLPYQLPWFPFPSQLNNSMRNNHEMWDQKCTINSSSYFYRIWFSLWLNNCLKRRMITWKQVIFVLRWKAVVVHEMREVAEHYIFNRSPENIFTLRFGSSGRVKQRQGKGQPRKQKHAFAKEQ